MPILASFHQNYHSLPLFSWCAIQLVLTHIYFRYNYYVLINFRIIMARYETSQELPSGMVDRFVLLIILSISSIIYSYRRLSRAYNIIINTSTLSVTASFCASIREPVRVGVLGYVIFTLPWNLEHLGSERARAGDTAVVRTSMKPPAPQRPLSSSKVTISGAEAPGSERGGTGRGLGRQQGETRTGRTWVMLCSVPCLRLRCACLLSMPLGKSAGLGWVARMQYAGWSVPVTWHSKGLGEVSDKEGG